MTKTNDELIRKDNERILKQLRALDAYINRKKNYEHYKQII